MSGLSQLERDLISARTKEGLEAARKRGKNGGTPTVEDATIQRALMLYEDKRLSIADICTLCNISKNTLYNYLRKANKEKEN